MANNLLRRYAASVSCVLTSIYRFLYGSYLDHWIAAPAGVIAAIVSTLGAASLMVFISAAYESLLSHRATILLNGVIGPLLAYIAYLLTYYSFMYFFEKSKTRNADAYGEFNWKEWCATVRYDYFAHLPSDVYLISLAGIMQCTLQFQGVSIFYALLFSQFVDDLVTFLKEPVIWAGANRLSKWESRSKTTLLREIRKLVKPAKAGQEKNV